MARTPLACMRASTSAGGWGLRAVPGLFVVVQVGVEQGPV